MEPFRIRLILEDQPDSNRLFDGRPLFLPVLEHVFSYPETEQKGRNLFYDLALAGDAELKRGNPQPPA